MVNSVLFVNKNILCFCYFYYLLWNESACFDRPEYLMSATYLVKNCRIVIKIGQKITNSLRGLNNKQTTPDSSVYLRDYVKRLVYALPDL